MYKTETRTVLYNKFDNYWQLEGSTRQLEYTSSKEWVELQERNSFPKENKYLTHEKLNWNLPALISTQYRYKVPTILKFILIEGDP
jgi:predicted nucleic acid-binding protein